MPESASYRKNVDEIVKHRLSIINTVSNTPVASSGSSKFLCGESFVESWSKAEKTMPKMLLS